MRTHKTMEIIILALFLILEVTFGAPLENGKHIFRDPIAPGYVKFGDMILPENFTMDGRNAIPYDQFRWPLGELPYVIDPSVSSYTNLISQAFQEYHAKTCIRFVPKQSSQRNYIRIFAGQGCYSNVGMINQGEQPVSLGQGCMIKGTVVHELGHAIGFFHEQNRSDRDENLVIYWANIQTGMESQFAKLAPNPNLLINPFDYSSVMLYGETAFSMDGRSNTMLSKAGSKLYEVYDKPALVEIIGRFLQEMVHGVPCDTLLA
ncbi:astacin-like metalloprotease toxin 5 isoform X2 [Folsomia candida]|uniref:astacin-like metalloprotease toxin 5 isoform X2 n=1 Tax=Folsomia candida TaxID=158441 RepID=UPI000B9001DE|nr:astacin-like metalloprotease toxin 5 isoform X2 [Folsomia candida]